MSMAVDLQCQSRGKSGISLAQFNSGLLRQDRQLRPRPLVEARIGRVGNYSFP